MEIREAEKSVIAKPIASRPKFSGFKSFSELLANEIDASPRNTFSNSAVSAIKPMTMRLKPVDNSSPVEMNTLEAERSDSEVSYPSDDVVKSERTSTVIYKPIAKLVSKTTISVLANLGRDNLSHQQEEISKVVCHAQTHNKANNDLEENSRADKNYVNDVDRPSYDGYNWRKYGQKQVKGSEYPRSYYKCTNQSCPVKKKVERMLDGRIAEVVYKGVHNHPKPRLLKHALLDGQGLGFSKYATCNEAKRPVPNEHQQRNERFGGGLVAHRAVETRVSTPDHSFGLSDEIEERCKGLDDEPKSKRRKVGNQSTKEGVLDPQTLNQNFPDCEVLGDGYRWRKYGQKVVKGNPYPRSYYRCTSLKCNVRKYVEKTSDDPSAFVTTYEGRHNHEMPIRNADSTSKTRHKQLTQ